MRHVAAATAPQRPLAYIAVDDASCRSQLTDALQHLGWMVIEQPSGFHLLRAISDLIDGEPGMPPGLIVIDAISRGCSGVTVARGLRDLGSTIPVVLVRDAWTPRHESETSSTYVVDRSRAANAIVELVRPWSPISLAQPSPSRARATA